ncbi:MAG: dihydroneopterin aldolase [Rhizobiales bacterium]|nr:dihydroneopterin aldolase [Hyphomicrobiales bacterium]
MNVFRRYSLLESSVVPRSESQALDIILINAFTGQTIIGINESELIHPQTVVIDIQAGVHWLRACNTDKIADTIDYSLICDRLRSLLSEHRFKLLEAFAQAIADLIIDHFGAVWVRVKVVKPHIFEDVEAVGVVIERRKSKDRL